MHVYTQVSSKYGCHRPVSASVGNPAEAWLNYLKPTEAGKAASGLVEIRRAKVPYVHGGKSRKNKLYLQLHSDSGRTAPDTDLSMCKATWLCPCIMKHGFIYV